MNKNSYLYRIPVLIFGLALFALGLAFIIHSGLGYDSWNVLQHGLTNVLPIGLGVASALVSIVMMIIAMISGEPLGLGTIFNGLSVGMMVQFIMDNHFLNFQDTIFMGGVYLLIGMIILGFASYFYMKVGLGSGPRDSFTVAMSKKTGIKMGYMKSIIEVIAVGIGISIGGRFGIGTVIGAVMTGVITQMVFNLLKFDPRLVKHESAKETIENMIKGKN